MFPVLIKIGTITLDTYYVFWMLALSLAMLWSIRRFWLYDDLSPFEEAMGVIEDVEHYGTREAMQIWNRGEAWISKRVGVRRYPEPVRALLEEDLCGD